MLLVVLLMATVVAVPVVILAGLMSTDNDRVIFNQFCTSECIDGKHYRNNYNDDQLY